MTALEFSKIWDAPMRRDHTMYSVAFAESYASAAQDIKLKKAEEKLAEFNQEWDGEKWTEK